jgi:hypothetical protein
MAKNEPDDIIDSMLAREPDPPSEEARRNVMVVGTRSETSASIEARENAYFDPKPTLGQSSAYWIIPFYETEDSEFPIPPNGSEAADLAHFGLSASEWMELHRRNLKEIRK